VRGNVHARLTHIHKPPFLAEFEIVVCRSFLSFIACGLAFRKSKDTKHFLGQLKNVPLLLGR
jgi:hypothetical protein